MIVIVAVIAYLLGSVPFGMVWARVYGLGDLRKIGSGNIGATNVLRTGNRRAAVLTLVCDAGKGGFAVLIAYALFGDVAGYVAGFAAFLGHCFPVYLRFQGGKGVATFLGTVLALAWPVGLAACATWAAVAGVFRFSSLAALVASLVAPLVAVLVGAPGLVLTLFGMTVLIFVRHRTNIARLVAGTEPRIGQK